MLFLSCMLSLACALSYAPLCFLIVICFGASTNVFFPCLVGRGLVDLPASIDPPANDPGALGVFLIETIARIDAACATADLQAISSEVSKIEAACAATNAKARGACQVPTIFPPQSSPDDNAIGSRCVLLMISFRLFDVAWQTALPHHILAVFSTRRGISSGTITITAAITIKN